MIASVAQDLRFGLRMLRRSPGFTAVALLCLALGIGSNSAVFSALYAFLVEPLPYAQSDRLVMVWESDLTTGEAKVRTGHDTIVDWRAANDTFDEIALVWRGQQNLTGLDRPIRSDVAAVSPAFFDVLGVQPLIGRVIAEHETRRGDDDVIVLGHRFWVEELDADPDVLGHVLVLDEMKHRVVGVMPESFTFPSRKVDLWVPLTVRESGFIEDRGVHWVECVGRLAEGVTVEEATDDLAYIHEELEREWPGVYARYEPKVVPLREELVGGLVEPLFVLWGAVVLVLLIGCANVAHLLLGRSLDRQSEIAVRRALGAGRLRLVRQLLTESVLLGCAGGALGLLLALWGVGLMRSFAGGDEGVSLAQELAIDGPVVVFTAVVSVFAGLLFGLLPALQVSRSQVVSSLKEGSGGVSQTARVRRLRHVLVTAEIALSLVLLVSAGLMARSVLALRVVDLGFDASDVAMARMHLPNSRYPTLAERRDFLDGILAEARLDPGVDAVAGAVSVPLAHPMGRSILLVEGREAPPRPQRLPVARNAVTSNYFEVLDIPLLRGRVFDARDDAESTPVAVISESMARAFFSEQQAIGQRMLWGPSEAEGEWLEIIGVVGDVRAVDPGWEAAPIVYMPISQSPLNTVSVLARSDGNLRMLASRLAEAVRRRDAQLPTFDVSAVSDEVDDSMRAERSITQLLIVFATLALVLAGVGVYAVAAHAVRGRSREIGLRMAMGAQPHHVVGMILRQSAPSIIIGVAIGLPVAAWLTRGLGDLLYDVPSTDPLTYGVVTAALVGVAVAASWWPSRRATRRPPMAALRHE